MPGRPWTTRMLRLRGIAGGLAATLLPVALAALVVAVVVGGLLMWLTRPSATASGLAPWYR